MAITNDYPFVSLVCPTYNCAAILDESLSSVVQQDYPKDKLELIIVDGGSTDGTIAVAQKYGSVILNNPLMLHPYGRPIGIQKAKGEIIWCHDSDNILVEKDWIKRMVAPFTDMEIPAVEPLYYYYRGKDSLLTKYCSLIGGDDPVVIYLGKHERYSYLTNTWTGVPTQEVDMGNYLKIKFLNTQDIPSLGANGFMIRKTILKMVEHNPFLHIDVCYSVLNEISNNFAKVKIGIVHVHANKFLEFIWKKKRRTVRRLDKNSPQKYMYKINKLLLCSLVVKSLVFVPLILHTIKGYKRKKERAWCIHPFITFLIIILYGSNVFFSRLKILNYREI